MWKSLCVTLPLDIHKGFHMYFFILYKTQPLGCYRKWWHRLGIFKTRDLCERICVSSTRQIMNSDWQQFFFFHLFYTKVKDNFQRCNYLLFYTEDRFRISDFLSFKTIIMDDIDFIPRIYQQTFSGSIGRATISIEHRIYTHEHQPIRVSLRRINLAGRNRHRGWFIQLGP